MELVNHDDRDHSPLGPSGSSQWLMCAGSIKASDEMRKADPSVDASNAAAEEGTEAHELADVILQNYDSEDIEVQVDHISASLVYFNGEMLQFCYRYADYCMSLGEGEVIRSTEQKVMMPTVHQDCWGTGDFSAFEVKPKLLHVADFKYGQGVFVDIAPDLKIPIEGGNHVVEANTQMLLYAEGQRIHLKANYGYEPKNYRLHVYQPRMSNIEQIDITAEQLAEFIEVAKYRAELTDLPLTNDQYNPGTKQCFWCVAKPICNAYANYCFDIAKREFDAMDEDPDMIVGQIKEGLMTDEQVGKLIADWENLDKMGAALRAYAHARLLEGGEMPGWKLVSGRASYRPNVEHLEFIFDDDPSVLYQEPKPLSKTALQKKLGKKVFDIVAAPYYSKHEGAPTMAPESDKRSAWKPDSYASDFEDD